MSDIFSRHAGIYDESRRQLIPCFDDFYGTPLCILRAYELEPKRALDLGAGTGLLSAIMARDIELESLVLLDQSAAMMERAALAFEEIPSYRTVVSPMQGLGAAGLKEGSFDAIWSALAIHHLTGEEKQTLFRQIHALLAPGGVFINADQSLGRTPKIEEIYRAQWLADIRDAGAEEEDIALALERMEEDRMDTLDDQIRWLEEAGFAEVNTWFQSFSFNVYSARK